MFEKLITQVLNKVLGDFIEDIDPAQLNISILNGNVSLFNMKMKSTFFESLPFPFSLNYGQIGAINLKIPVLNLLSQPLIIEIRDVFAIVRPKHIKEWNEEVEIKAYQNSNQSMLEQYEMFTQSTDALQKKDPSSIDKMITKILDNLEISIKNIYIRYEDSFSAPNQGEGKFVVGVLLKEFSTFTTGSDWKNKFMSQGEDITHKLAKLINFTIFMDYQFEDKQIQQDQKGVMIIGQNQDKEQQVYSKIDYDKLFNDKSNKEFISIINNEIQGSNIKHSYIVENFSMEARLKINKNPINNKGPQIDLNLLLGGQFKQLDDQDHDISIKLHVHQPQIIRLLKLLEYIGYYNEFQNGALSKLSDKPLAQEAADEYIKHYVEWKTIKDEKKHAKTADEKRKLMRMVEDEYPSQKIIVLRKFANKVITQQEEEKKMQDDINKQVKDLASQKKGWSLFTSKEKKAQQQQEIDDFKKKLQEDFIKKKQQEDQELDQELLLLTKDLQSQIIVNKEDFDKMELGYIRFRFKISVPAITLKFYNEFDQTIFKAQLLDQVALIDLGKGVTRVFFSLWSLQIDDHWTHAKAFPRFVDTKELSNNGAANDEANQSVTKAQALMFELSMNPQGSISPFKIDVKLEKPIFLVANFHFIKEIKRTLISAFEGEQLDLSFFQEAATERALQYMQSGKELIQAIKKGQFKHQALDLYVFMTAPIILVPENIFNPHKPCIVIDTGSIQLNSNLVEYRADIDYKQEVSVSKLYDNYEIKLQNFQINILNQGLPEGLSEFKRGQGSQIIKKFNARIIFFNCLEPMHPLFPTLELSIIIQNFEAQFGLKAAKNLLRLQNAIVEQLDSKEDKIFEQVDKSKLSQLQKLHDQDLIQAFRLKSQGIIKRGNSIQQQDDLYSNILEDIDPKQYEEMKNLQKKYSYQAPIEEIASKEKQEEQLQEEGKSSKFKLYFSAEKLQLAIKEDEEQKENNAGSILNALILNFGLEVDIDRKLDPHVNISIYKILIEDTQQDARISAPFRMILSSPLSDYQRESNITDDAGIDFEFSVLQRSLLNILYEENNEEFKDAIDDEEQQIVNEFELQINVLKNHIDINCQISDLRFVFAVPTAQKLANIGLKVKEILDQEEQIKLNERKVKLEMYEYVLARLQQVFQTDEENLVKRVLINYAFASGLDPQLGQLLYQESIQRLYQLYSIKQEEKEQTIKDAIQPENKESMFLRYIKKHNEKLYERTEEIKSKLEVKANLKNLSIWIPLNAELDDSQLLSLSLMSDLRFNSQELSLNTYEATLNELIKKEPIQSNDQLAFSINHLIVEMLRSRNYFELLQTRRESNYHLQKNQNNDLFQTSRLIEPCRITLQINNEKIEKEQLAKSDIVLMVEPIQISIGFNHIDFANLILVQVEETLKFVDQILKDNKKQEQPNKLDKHVKKIKEELKEHEQKLGGQIIKIEEEKEGKLKKYRKDQKIKTKVQSIKLDLESLTISLNDDSQAVHQPLFQAFLINTYVNVKIRESDDDAATFLLKKMGIFQKRNPKLSDQQHLDINAFAQLNVNYFNQRSLAFEPLLEKYYLLAQLSQLTPYTAQNIKLQSDKFLNANLTFGMALTLNKIKVRVLESLKAAEIIRKMKVQKEQISADEIKIAQNWTEKMNRNNFQQDTNTKLNEISGFVFANYTGLKIRAEVHDSMKTDLIKQQSEKDPYAEAKINKSSLFASEDTSFNLSNKVHDYQLVKIPFDTIYNQQKLITQRKHKGQIVESIVEEPLKMDFNIEGLDKLSGIPIENLGVHSYRTQFQVKSAKGGKGSDNVGIICNVKMEGNQKTVSLESQLLFVNNLSQPVSVFVQEYKSKSYPNNSERATIEPNQIFRVPLTWLFAFDNPIIYLEGRANNYEIFNSLHSLFTDDVETTKLEQKHSHINRLAFDYFVSIDIQSFKCLPKVPVNGPPQYVVSFNPPVMVSNYNFQPLEIRINENNLINLVTLMGPKETAYINNIDGYKAKPDLYWNFYENKNDKFTLSTKAFSIPDRLEEQQTIEKFSSNAKSKKDIRYLNLTFDIRKNHFYNVPAYQENFELREKYQHNYTSAVQIMIYPRYMMINKSSLPIICENQTIMPYSNDYFNQTSNKVEFKVPGYKYSQSIDITTIGLSGSIALDLDQKKDVPTDQLPQKEYIPQRLEMGVIIKSAPSPFNKTVLIEINPRFIFVNQLGVPIVIRQIDSASQVLISGQQMPFNLELKSTRLLQIRQALKDELVGISQGRKLYQDLAHNDPLNTFWSSPFNIDDVDDFQIAYAGQDVNHDEADLWYNPSDINNYHRFVRVIVTTQNDATILVVFSNPVFPEYEIVNKTDSVIEFAQMQESSYLSALPIAKRFAPEEQIIGKFGRLSGKTTTPFVWNNRSYSNRMLAIKIGQTLKEVNIDTAAEKIQFEATNQIIFNVEVTVSGNAKRIKITNLNSEKESYNKAKYLQYLLKRYQNQKFNIGIQLKGIGLSLIDEMPQELLYLSLYDIKLELQRWGEQRSDGSGAMENITKLTLYLKHVQLDNMVNQIMPVLLVPTKALAQKNTGDGQKKPIKEIEESKEEQKQGDPKSMMVVSGSDDDVPFIQLIVTIAESQDLKSKSKQLRLRAFQFLIQEFKFQIETSILNTNIKFIIELIQTFSDNKKYLVILANSESFERAKTQPRELICEALDAKKNFIEDNQIQSNKMFIEYVHLGAIKAIITFKLEKSAVDLDISDPMRGFGILNLFYSIVANVASFSNSNLTFSELVLTNVFVSEDVLTKTIAKNYTRQAVMQFYKLIGSSDLIGNPVGLVNKLGTGVFEFVSEPTKGLLKGPDEFVGGVGKGVQSLVSNVISGGFESVGKIGQSLYNVVKNVGGEKKQDLKKPDHVVDGVYQGVKGGASEIIGGVTGIFTKPMEKSKKEGASGFFKGVGQGLFGAISAPVTAVLRVGTSVAQGVSATATSIGNIGKDNNNIDANSIYSRFRPPRYINTRNVITDFDEDLATVSTIIQELSNGKYANHSIKYYCYLPETKINGDVINHDTNSSLLILTEGKLFYLRPDQSRKGKPTLLFQVSLRKVQSCEVYQTSAGNIRTEATFILTATCYTVAKGQYRYQFYSTDYSKLEKMYNMLSILPQVEAEDKVKGVKSKASQILSQCL